MSAFDPKTAKFRDGFTPDPGMGGEVAGNIQWRNVAIEMWLKQGVVFTAKALCALAWAASFSGINPMGATLFLADFVPFTLPVSMQDTSVATLVNLCLGILAVALPTILWHYALQGVLSQPKTYFGGNPLRIVIASLLVLGYTLTITLEILSLLGRIEGSLDTGPIPVLGEKPQILPLAIASATLVLGSCLLGLASASLTRSLINRYSVR